MNTIQARLIALIFTLTSMTCWADSLGLDTQGNDEFLPVEQAYQASIIVEPNYLVIDWVIAPGYYLYKEKFKLSAITQEGKTILEGQYSPGTIKYDEYYGKDVESFYITTQIKVPLAGVAKKFELKMRSQGCADAGLCYPPRSQYFQIDQKLGAALETERSTMASDGSSGTRSNQSPSSTLSGTQNTAVKSHSFLVYILFAIGGGLLLNLMPCVFPVLSLKALSFASTSGSAHSHHLHGWAYTLGVVGSFVTVALLIFAAKAAGEQTGWGFQLQSPVFVASMVYLFLVMGLSLSGMVHFGTGLMGIGHGLTAQEGLRGSFFTGILAAVVASPCTGPLMAPALGFALTQPAIVSLSIFVALGFGLALPFLLLSYSPKLASLLPHPGAWMERLKELLAFPMYLTAAWLLFVFGRQVGMTGLFFLLIGAIAIVFAIWLFQNQPTNKNIFHWLVKLTGFASLFFAGSVAVTSESFRNQTDDWLVFSKQQVKELREQGQPVFVDFTADWCITCKMNESIALSGEEFDAAVNKYNVALVKGDWTNEDAAISEVLKEFDRSGVPLYLMYPADTSKAPEVLPQLLTKNLVIEAIERANK